MKSRRSWGPAEQKITGARQLWKCKVCDCMLPASFELDHVVPLWKGGADDHETNAQALCGTCHGQKSQREQIERTQQHRRTATVRVVAAKIRSDTFGTDNPFLQFAYIPGI